jgi:xanthine dehydrogenase YagR molybdenum-binding subunit
VTAETVSGNPIGAALDRVEGRDKVTGRARYAYEYPAERLAYAVPVQSTIARGQITGIDDTAALGMPGVLAVLWHENAPRLGGGTAGLRILQGPAVSYRGQIVAAVVAETLETAREAQRHVRVEYREDQARVELSPSDPGLYRPDRVFPDYPTDTGRGDVAGALAAAEVVLDETYTTAATHNNPMEPHAAMAEWQDGQLILHDSTQGASMARDTIAAVLGLPAGRVRVISPHVGGGFGSKGTPRPHTVLAAIAAQVAGRPVKVAFTCQQMWPLTGYRSPTIQRVRLGADAGGRLTAIAHDVIAQTSATDEFAERAATVTRIMYAAPNRRTTHRLARLNVPTPSWMRAPGEAPGSFAPWWPAVPTRPGGPPCTWPATPSTSPYCCAAAALPNACPPTWWQSWSGRPTSPCGRTARSPPSTGRAGRRHSPSATTWPARPKPCPPRRCSS